MQNCITNVCYNENLQPSKATTLKLCTAASSSYSGCFAFKNIPPLCISSVHIFLFIYLLFLCFGALWCNKLKTVVCNNTLMLHLHIVPEINQRGRGSFCNIIIYLKNLLLASFLLFVFSSSAKRKKLFFFKFQLPSFFHKRVFGTERNKTYTVTVQIHTCIHTCIQAWAVCV